jgi:hypothetical protein
VLQEFYVTVTVLKIVFEALHDLATDIGFDLVPTGLEVIGKLCHVGVVEAEILAVKPLVGG